MERSVDEIVALVRSRQVGFHGPDESPLSCPPLAQKDALTNEERRLGFQLPPLLKRLYCEVCNGGFGPGYGLIGLSGGASDDLGRTAPEIYESFLTQAPSDLGWSWPRRLLPICNWGCAIYSCVDCTAPDFPMKIFDPNLHANSQSWADAFFDEASSFEVWIEAWGCGQDLWEKSYGDEGFITRELRRRGPNGLNREPRP